MHVVRRTVVALTTTVALVLTVGVAPAAAATYPVGPGRVGDAYVGMSVNRAMKTGQFNRDVEYVVPGACRRIIPLQPKGVWKKRYDVIVARGRIQEMGIFAARPRTPKGAGVGSRLRELRDTYGDRLSEPEEAGYAQWAVFVHGAKTGRDRRWIGFLLGTAYIYEGPPRGRAKVTFMAVSKGKKPALQRDGC